MSEDIFRGFGIEVNLKSNFNTIRESLSRIGYGSRNENVLYQSCHIFHKRERYAIMHFKELFAFDGKPAEITSEDLARRNTIVGLLNQWGLVDVKVPIETMPKTGLAKIMVVPYADKGKWTFKTKYKLGK